MPIDFITLRMVFVLARTIGDSSGLSPNCYIRFFLFVACVEYDCTAVKFLSLFFHCWEQCECCGKAVCRVIHVAVECSWEEPPLAYALAGPGIELFENIAEGL
jgi:hypothetical protein